MKIVHLADVPKDRWVSICGCQFEANEDNMKIVHLGDVPTNR